MRIPNYIKFHAKLVYRHTKIYKICLYKSFCYGEKYAYQVNDENIFCAFCGCEILENDTKHTNLKKVANFKFKEGL